MATVLFATKNSIYKKLGCDVYDIDRDARTYPGGAAAIYHPPCRIWSKLKAFAKPRAGEKDLAIWSVNRIRLYGGVLEHPRHSSLWKYMNLPLPGTIDEYGGFTLFIQQSWFGHLAPKDTFLYIVGCTPSEIPNYSPNYEPYEYSLGGTKYTKDLPKKYREATPEKLATWLIDLVNIINQKNKGGI